MLYCYILYVRMYVYIRMYVCMYVRTYVCDVHVNWVCTYDSCCVCVVSQCCESSVVSAHGLASARSSTSLRRVQGMLVFVYYCTTFQWRVCVLSTYFIAAYHSIVFHCQHTRTSTHGCLSTSAECNPTCAKGNRCLPVLNILSHFSFSHFVGMVALPCVSPCQWAEGSVGC